MGKALYIVASVFTDKGQGKEINQDNFYFNGDTLSKEDSDSFSKGKFFEEGEGFFVICDGMGGNDFGQKASSEVVLALKDYMKTFDIFGSIEQYIQKLNLFIAEMNDKIFKMAVHYPDLKGMGTTFSSLLIKDGKAIALNAGDSRVYLFRNGRLKQITVDNTEAERMFRLGIITKDEAKRHIKRFIVSKYIGLSPLEGKLEAESSELFEIENGDYFILCSNSLNELVEERKISELINGNPVLEELGQKLLLEAQNNGAKDNLTYILLKVQADAVALGDSKKEGRPLFTSVFQKLNIKTISAIIAAGLGLVLMTYVLFYLFGIMGIYMNSSSSKGTNPSVTKTTPTSSAPIETKNKAQQHTFISPIPTAFIEAKVASETSPKPTVVPTKKAVPATKAPLKTVIVTNTPSKTPQAKLPSPPIQNTEEVPGSGWERISDIVKEDNGATASTAPSNNITASSKANTATPSPVITKPVGEVPQ